jgi:hypothetical protein
VWGMAPQYDHPPPSGQTGRGLKPSLNPR